MNIRICLTAPLALLAFATAAPAAAQIQSVSVTAQTPAPAKGVIRMRSARDFDATVAAIKADVAAKGIRFFAEIDQQALGAEAGLKVRRSTLILFGNPPLGVQFIQSNPYAALDWPVRMLVLEDETGQVWVAWTDFDWIGDRYGITDRDPQLRMASQVAASIASSANR